MVQAAVVRGRHTNVQVTEVVLPDLSALASHRIGLDRLNSAFERMRGGTGARSLIVFE